MFWLILVIIAAVFAWAYHDAREKHPLGAPQSTAVDLSFLPSQFIVFDLETTGLDPDKHRIIEMAAIRVNTHGDNHDTWRTFVKIPGKVPPRITALTGITTDMLRTGTELHQAVREFLAFAGTNRLVSFNIDFDMGFLQAAARNAGLHVTNPTSCALKMARRAWPGRSSYKLAALARDGGLAAQDHRALSDCQLALAVYTAAAVRLRSVS